MKWPYFSVIRCDLDRHTSENDAILYGEISKIHKRRSGRQSPIAQVLERKYQNSPYSAVLIIETENKGWNGILQCPSELETQTQRC